MNIIAKRMVRQNLLKLPNKMCRFLNKGQGSRQVVQGFLQNLNTVVTPAKTADRTVVTGFIGNANSTKKISFLENLIRIKVAGFTGEREVVPSHPGKMKKYLFDLKNTILPMIRQVNPSLKREQSVIDGFKIIEESAKTTIKPQEILTKQNLFKNKRAVVTGFTTKNIKGVITTDVGAQNIQQKKIGFV